MVLPSAGEIALVVAVFSVAGLTLVGMLSLFVRPRPFEIDRAPTPKAFPTGPASIPVLRLEALEEQGFLLIELYDDAVAAATWRESTPLPLPIHGEDEQHAVVRTAKVLHAASGRVELRRVLGASPPSR
ncbi:MAG: hypothetical protein ACLFR7_03415 [Opitutales bacterium]